MKYLALFLASTLLILACDGTEDPEINSEARQEMRDFVIQISETAKATDSEFIIIPQNGVELATENSEEDGPSAMTYLEAIDAIGQEDLFYGYNQDDQETPASDNAYLRIFIDIMKNSGNAVLITDYCSTPEKMSDSYTRNLAEGYISFAAHRRELDLIPSFPDPIHNENADDIVSVNDAKNFLYLINPSQFSSKADFIAQVSSTNYDLILMDLFFDEGNAFTQSEIEMMKAKHNGGKRLVISYMSIGEAEDYRYYWNPTWNTNKPEWLDAENQIWQGNFKVKYWNSEWKDIILSEDGYLDRILNAGFDGVYLDLIEAYEYYE